MSNRRTANPIPGTGHASQDIGGGIVRRRFSSGGKEFTNGTVLSAGEIKAMPRNNMNALRDNGYIHIFPKAVRSHLEAAPEDIKMERHVVSRGFGKYDVIEGKVMNTQPLTKETAEHLASQLKIQDGTVTQAPPVPEVRDPLTKPQTADELIAAIAAQG